MSQTVDVLPARAEPRATSPSVADARIATLAQAERRLSDRLRRLRASGGAADIVRELIVRRLAVRARLDEATQRRADADAAAEEARRRAEAEEARLAAIAAAEEERREFHLACLRAPQVGRHTPQP